MADHVGVGVPHQTPRMLDPEPAQNQRPAFAQPMRVVPEPNPHVEAPLLVNEHRSDSASACTNASPERIVVAFPAATGHPARDSAPFRSHFESTLCHFEKKSFKIGHKLTHVPREIKFSSKKFKRSSKT